MHVKLNNNLNNNLNNKDGISELTQQSKFWEAHKSLLHLPPIASSVEAAANDEVEGT